MHSICDAGFDYKDALAVGIANAPKSTLANLADRVFLVRARREESIAATRTKSARRIRTLFQTRLNPHANSNPKSRNWLVAAAPRGRCEAPEKPKGLTPRKIIITDRSNREADRFAGAPIPYIIPAQRFAAALEGTKVLNADQRRSPRKVTPNL